MKKIDRDKVIPVVIAIVIMGGVTILTLVDSTPGRTDIECTTEYVNMNGSKDCENRMKANQAESEAGQESQVR